jgi:hypothetical protein
MNIEKIFKLAKRFEKKSQYRKYKVEDYDYERGTNDLHDALEKFEADYVKGASEDDLVKLKDEIDDQIDKSIYAQQDKAISEGEYDEFAWEPVVPRFLAMKIDIVNEAINHLKFQVDPEQYDTEYDEW